MLEIHGLKMATADEKLLEDSRNIQNFLKSARKDVSQEKFNDLLQKHFATWLGWTVGSGCCGCLVCQPCPSEEGVRERLRPVGPEAATALMNLWSDGPWTQEQKESLDPR